MNNSATLGLRLIHKTFRDNPFLMSEHFGFQVEFFFLFANPDSRPWIFGSAGSNSLQFVDSRPKHTKGDLVFSREKMVQIRYSVLRTKQKNIGNFEFLELGSRTCIISVYGDSRKDQNSTRYRHAEWRSRFRPTTDGMGSLVGRPSRSSVVAQSEDSQTRSRS